MHFIPFGPKPGDSPRNAKLFGILVCWLRVRILFYERAKCLESIATSLKHAFFSIREHLQLNFNSNVLAWYVPFMIRFVQAATRFVLKRGSFCP